MLRHNPMAHGTEQPAGPTYNESLQVAEIPQIDRRQGVLPHPPYLEGLPPA
jgi:hypothetical protein